MITCDEIIDAEAETVPINFNEKRCETKSFYILFTFLLITIPLLVPVSIYCFFIKHQAKKNHLLPFHVTNNELKQVIC